MAIPDQQQPFPRWVRPSIRIGAIHNTLAHRTPPSIGVVAPGGPETFAGVSVPTTPIPGPQGNAQKTSDLVASDTNSVSFVVRNQQTLVVDVPMLHIYTPYSTTTPLRAVASSPTIQLPPKATLGSVQAIPMAYLVGSATPIQITTLGRGVQVRLFFVRVMFSLGGVIPVGQSGTVTCTLNLYTVV